MTAGAALMKGRWKALSMVLGIVITVLVGLGGMALVYYIAGLLGANPTWWVLVGWFAAGGLFLVNQNWIVRIMAAQSAKAAMHQGRQVIAFDQAGVHYETGDLRWLTPWSMIDQVVATKRTVTLIAGGIAFSVPKETVGDNDAVEALVSDLKEQIANA